MMREEVKNLSQPEPNLLEEYHLLLDRIISK